MQTHFNFTALWSIINEHTAPPPFFYYIQLQLTGSLRWPITDLSCKSERLVLFKWGMTHRAKTSRGLVRGRIIHFHMCQNSSRGLKNKWDSPQIKTFRAHARRGRAVGVLFNFGRKKKEKKPWELTATPPMKRNKELDFLISGQLFLTFSRKL